MTDWKNSSLQFEIDCFSSPNSRLGGVDASHTPASVAVPFALLRKLAVQQIIELKTNINELISNLSFQRLTGHAHGNEHSVELCLNQY